MGDAMNIDVQDAYRDWLNRDTAWGRAMAKMERVRDCPHLDWHIRLPSCPACDATNQDVHMAYVDGGFSLDLLLKNVFENEYKRR